MDRSDLARDLEYSEGPQSVRTGPTVTARGEGGYQSEVPLGARGSVAAGTAHQPETAWPGFYPSTHEVPTPVAPAAPIGAVKRALAFAKKAVRWIGYAVLAYFALVTALIFVYRFANPPASALMLQQGLSGGEVSQIWVPLSAIAPSAVRSVMVSEDGRFCEHWGVDYDAIQSAIERAGKKGPRGASTISMQVAKNLFLWPSKSYLRKALEIPLTYMIEAWWPKRRIMEVYLNIAEWGPGIFGIEAASRYHFAKPALHLSPREAAQLAVTLPSPIRRDAGEPGPQARRLASLVQFRTQGASRATFACLAK